jgi:hypothetical protein
LIQIRQSPPTAREPAVAFPPASSGPRVSRSAAEADALFEHLRAVFPKVREGAGIIVGLVTTIIADQKLSCTPCRSSWQPRPGISRFTGRAEIVDVELCDLLRGDSSVEAQLLALGREATAHMDNNKMLAGMAEIRLAIEEMVGVFNDADLKILRRDKLVTNAFFG